MIAPQDSYRCFRASLQGKRFRDVKFHNVPNTQYILHKISRIARPLVAIFPRFTYRHTFGGGRGCFVVFARITSWGHD